MSLAEGEANALLSEVGIMRNSIVWCAGAAATLIVAAGPSRPAAAGEEATITAFASWHGEGSTIQTGAEQATFVGALTGRIYVETERGPLASGSLACPAMVEIGLKDDAQHGQGRCTITARDGAQIFAEIACSGYYLLGCNGDLKLTGGTERFSGITGGGKVIIRSDERRITVKRDRSMGEEGSGILYVKELSYKLP
jgi:hypothetical protein